MTERLAIVVPAWKPQFLAPALASIAAQTDSDFDTYVFDDAGPPEVAAISARFPPCRYHRFDHNLGRRALVQHWNRCLAMVPNRWVWLFADDDVMAPGSVAAVRAAIARQPALAVWQLPVQMVSEDLRTVLWSSMPPAWESAADFLRARLRGERLSCLPDHVFDAHRLRALGGLVDLPLAWNADDASWLLLARDGGLGGVAADTGAGVSWRQSSDNISGTSKADRVGRSGRQGRPGEADCWQKLDADLLFIERIQGARVLGPADRPLIRRWLQRRLTDLYGLRAADLRTLWRHLPWGWRAQCAVLMLRLAWRGVRGSSAPAGAAAAGLSP